MEKMLLCTMKCCLFRSDSCSTRYLIMLHAYQSFYITFKFKVYFIKSTIGETLLFFYLIYKRI